MKNILRDMSKSIFLLIISLFLSAEYLYSQNKGVELTLDQAIDLIKKDSRSLKVAEQELEWAKNEKQRLNAFWYPQVMATGAYVHTSNKIEVKQPLSQYTDPAIDYIQQAIPGEEVITSILQNIGKSSLTVPLFPQNMTTVDAVATLPLFTGGKRLYANKIGGLMVDMAEINKEQVNTNQQVLLVELYYSLRLGQQVVEVRRETYNALERHYQNALKFEANGMLNKAERLYFQVNRDEAKRELDVAIKDLSVVQNSLKTLLQIDYLDDILPVSSLFINEFVPSVDFFKNLVSQNNYLVNGLEVQHNIQENQLKVARSAYLPNIELFAKQTLYSNGVPKNLLPRTMVGVGFSWNIFDGLDREKKIKQAKINKYILEIQKDKIIDDMSLAVDKFYNQMQTALDNVTALKTTVEMSRELVRTRQLAFAEGMATSTEIIDAELMLSKVRIATLLAYFQYDSGLINLLSVCGIADTFDEYSLKGKDESHFYK